MQRLHEERAPGESLPATPRTRETHHLPEQMTGPKDSTDRAMLRLMGVLRRIAESNISDEGEVAA